ncbi:hypothetical protein [Winogradskya humida]|uniref:Uncharacterized protein n=1 Tax=Winogradskya humida TaxID=113566 RepID=A0ABQ3ZGP3_9ACTN|nr:hypothetical protein [Actinoplanes humidus]GIE17748.1 hypothetical protein Ahu01nite_008500 [Actinoplanes humidus]
MKLFLGEGATSTLVGRRAPAASVPCDHFVLGSLTVLRPRDDARVTFELPLTAGWRLLGRSAGDYRVLTAPADQDDFRRAADAAVLTLHHWPSLRRHLDLDDPSPTLATTLWDLAGILTDRARVRESQLQLGALVQDIPAGSHLRAEVAERVLRAQDRMAHLDADVERQVEHLARLADETAEFIREQQALRKAEAVLRDADYLLHTGTPPSPKSDSAADLTDRTTAVLAAYQELTR